MAHVRIAHHESGATYGAPRVQQELQAHGLPVSAKRVARLMREDGLVARRRAGRRVSTTNSNHDDPIAPNLLASIADACVAHGNARAIPASVPTPRARYPSASATCSVPIRVSPSRSAIVRATRSTRWNALAER